MKTNNSKNCNNYLFYNEIISLQEKLAKKVSTENRLPTKIKRICGIDVCYKKNIGYGVAVIYDKDKQKILQVAKSTVRVSFPYLPGLFMLRESNPIQITLKKLTKHFDVLLIDANGQLHPRKFGLACYIGLLFDKPSIGVAKKLLCGKVKPDHTVELGGKTIGYEIIKNEKKIYVSVGHKISLKAAVKIVKEIILNDFQPEPLRLADLFSKKESKK